MERNVFIRSVRWELNTVKQGPVCATEIHRALTPPLVNSTTHAGQLSSTSHLGSRRRGRIQRVTAGWGTCQSSPLTVPSAPENWSTGCPNCPRYNAFCDCFRERGKGNIRRTTRLRVLGVCLRGRVGKVTARRSVAGRMSTGNHQDALAIGISGRWGGSEGRHGTPWHTDSRWSPVVAVLSSQQSDLHVVYQHAILNDKEPASPKDGLLTSIGL